MGVTTTPSSIGLTPVCNDCGIYLCWDIPEAEYEINTEFWDAWICEVCNGGTPFTPQQKRAIPPLLIPRKEPEMSEGIEIYKAIVAVAGELAKEGIAKDRKCTQGATYNFRGIDDIYNALAPFLAKHSLCILPRMVARDSVERLSKNGGALFYTTVEAEFDFVSAVDGSRHTVRTFGEAMDSGDKGTNKAMSAAYKYAAFQAFCIPTEGDNDTENQTHEVQPRQQQQRQQKAAEKAQQQQHKQGQTQTKEPATQEQLAKISDLILALHNRDGGSEADILKTISLFPGTNGDIWLTPDTLEKKCTKGYAGKIIGKAEEMLKS